MLNQLNRDDKRINMSSGNQQKIGFLAGKSAKIVNTIKVLTICAVVSTLCFLNTVTVFSATKKKTYYVEVTYFDCPEGSAVSQSRSEIWREGGNAGNTVYTETRGCDGNTSTAGKKPLIGEGGDMWDVAYERADLLDIPVAASIAMDYPPFFDTTKTDSSGKKTADLYEFEFPIDWVYEVAITSITQTSTSVTIKTDAPVQAMLVNLNTGLELTGFIPVTTSYPFDISSLSVGCIYSIIVRQYIEEADEILVIGNHNFCKETGSTTGE